MRAAQRGVTLVELLVALGIFAMVSAASMAVLNLALSGREQLERATDEVRELERMRTLMRADLSQIVKRAVREQTGQTTPVMIGGEALGTGGPGSLINAPVSAGEEVLVVLTRSGWDNPGALRPRASLQRVTYLVANGDLIRRTRPFLDADLATPNQDQILLSGLTTAVVAFHDGQEWRPGFASEESQVPRAVRFEIDHPDTGVVRHDFLVGPR